MNRSDFLLSTFQQIQWVLKKYSEEKEFRIRLSWQQTALIAFHAQKGVMVKKMTPYDKIDPFAKIEKKKMQEERQQRVHGKAEELGLDLSMLSEKDREATLEMLKRFD